jgi:hypothetical protein
MTAELVMSRARYQRYLADLFALATDQVRAIKPQLGTTPTVCIGLAADLLRQAAEDGLEHAKSTGDFSVIHHGNDHACRWIYSTPATPAIRPAGRSIGEHTA